MTRPRPASGAKPQHTYAAAGTYNVTLTVTDNQGATNSVSHQVTVAAPVNQAPVAAFSSAPNGLAVAFDGSGSSDPDGTVASYSWDFGDQTAAGSGAKPSHTYAAAGTYNVTLTVTDNQGATNSVSHQVTVAAPVNQPLATDTFTRTGTGTWGTADVGGAWTLSGGSWFSTDGSTGKVKLSTAGTTVSAQLNSVSATDVNEVMDVQPDSVGTGSGTYVSLLARRSGKNDYRLKLRLMSGGVVHLIESKVVNGTETTLREVAVSGVTYAAGDVLRLRFQVTGTGTATLAGKVWNASTTEPAAAQISLTDNDAALQVPGAVGTLLYLSSTSTTPVTVTVDNFTAVKPN